MDITPDLSHLTAEERQIIEAVLNREKVEEKLNASTTQPHNDDDYSSPVAVSSRRYSQANESGVFCQICQKTKFVNEKSSRQCSLCKKRFCVRCGIRLKSQYYVCNQCRQKQEQYFSSTKNICKQSVSDYILSQTFDDNPMNKNGANQKRILPIPKVNNTDDDISSPDSISTCDNNKRLLPVIKQDIRSTNILRDFQYHSLEERELGQESTLKDSGIDTASSSTILNVISSDQFKKPMTYWRFNETRTEQIGYIYLKNNHSSYEYEQGKADIFNVLGLKIQAGVRYENEDIVEITKVIPGSIADTYGQLRVGDQILEWNREKLTNLNSNLVHRIALQSSIQSPHIHLIVKRSIKYPTLLSHNHSLPNPISQDDKTIPSTTEKRSIQLQLSFQYDRREFHVMIYGAKNIHIQQGLFACQLSLQFGRDILSKEEKCTKGQPCSAGICTWNQHIIFFDIDTIDNMSLWIKLINLEHNQDVLGEIKFNKLDLNAQSEWYSLHDISHSVLEPSFSRTLPSTTDISSTMSNRKRQLPNIPLAQLDANREKVTQDLLQKATEFKLRLHMQAANDKLLPTQRSLDHADAVKKQVYGDRSDAYDKNSGTSMLNLSSRKLSSAINIKEKPRIPIMRDKSAPNSGENHFHSTIPKRTTTTTGQTKVDLEKTKLKSFEEKSRKPLRKRDSSEKPGDDIDSDGSELSAASKQSSPSMLSSQSERPRHTRKIGVHTRANDHHHHQHFHRHDEIQLNEEEIRQMAMRTHDTSTNSNSDSQTTITETNTKTPSASTPNDKISNTSVISKPDQRNDGTVSDSVLSTPPESNKKRRPSMSSKALVILGLSKKANSAANLGMAKRYGFQRSEEIGVQHHLRNRALERQTSKENDTPSSAPVTNPSQSPFALSQQSDQHNSLPLDIRKLWSGALKLPHEHQFAAFVDGLGTGQLVGRQVLASPCLGDIQIGLREQRGLLEVEIVRARNLFQKGWYKTPPAPYVKVYILDGKTCIEKQRTRTTRRTLDPLIQQTLTFKEGFREKVLQIGVWGDYGKLDRKVFMGVCQISLEEVNMNSSQHILDWYKLFSVTSLMNNYTNAQQSLTRRNSITTNDSFSSLKANSRF